MSLYLQMQTALEARNCNLCLEIRDENDGNNQVQKVIEKLWSHGKNLINSLLHPIKEKNINHGSCKSQSHAVKSYSKKEMNKNRLKTGKTRERRETGV
mmetsp:Transcript_21432/g.37705  ORF Transcript_21432/g.37705 Transcript_21432/m.37705 type:complete len:98 (-) Transcript_21432:750-1043(-)